MGKTSSEKKNEHIKENKQTKEIMKFRKIYGRAF